MSANTTNTASMTRRQRTAAALARAESILREMAGEGFSIYGGPELDPDDGQVLVWLGAHPTKWCRKSLLRGWHPWAHHDDHGCCVTAYGRFVGESWPVDLGGDCPEHIVFYDGQAVTEVEATRLDDIIQSSLRVAFRPWEGALSPEGNNCEPAQWAGLSECEV